MQTKIQFTTLHSVKKQLQSLKHIQYIALRRLMKQTFKSSMRGPQLARHCRVQVAWTSLMFSLTKQCAGKWLSKSLSSSDAASPTSWWSNAFSAAPQTGNPDGTDSAQPCEFSPPGTLALTGSRRLAWRIQASEIKRGRVVTLKKEYFNSRTAGNNGGLRMTFRIRKLRGIKLAEREVQSIWVRWKEISSTKRDMMISSDQQLSISLKRKYKC